MTSPFPGSHILNPEFTKTTTCPFCLYGCELGILSEPVIQVEYSQNAKVNQGRLCPRGNAAPIVLNHKRRLAYPLLGNKEISWQKAEEILISYLKNYRQDEMAITFDQGLTKEEFNLLQKFITQLGVTNFACSYLEPDLYFSYHLEDTQIAHWEDIEQAQVFVLIGDVFGQTPVLAQPILTRRYAERNNRLFVIDSIPTRTAGFADKFLQCAPSTEPLLILALFSLLARKTIKGLELETIAEVTHCPTSEIEAVAKTLSEFNSGVVVGCLCFGRTENPYLLALAAQTLATKTKLKFLKTGEFAPFEKGIENFGNIFNKIKEGKIKLLINFGDYFPFHYPQIQTDLSALAGLVATALFRPTHFNKGLFLPCPSNLEKNGTIQTLWGETKINKVANPVSGSKTIIEIIESVLREQDKSMGHKPPDKSVTIREVYEQAKELLSSKKTVHGLQLIGEKPAIGFLNFFDDEDVIKINPADADKLKVHNRERVSVSTQDGKQYQTTLVVKTTREIPCGVALVGVNRIENRQLFKMVIDKATNNVIFSPTVIKVWPNESS